MFQDHKRTKVLWLKAPLLLPRASPGRNHRDAPASPEVLSCVSVHHPLPQEAQYVAHSRPSPGTSHTSPGPSDASKQDTHPHTLPKAKQQLAPGPRLLGSPGQPSKHHGFTLLADRARGLCVSDFPTNSSLLYVLVSNFLLSLNVHWRSCPIKV